MNGTSLMGIGVHMTSGYQEMVDYAALLHMYDVRYCAVKPRFESSHDKLLPTTKPCNYFLPFNSKVPPIFNFLRPFQSTVWLLALITLLLGIVAYVYVTIGQSSDDTAQERVLLIWGTYFAQSKVVRTSLKFPWR